MDPDHKPLFVALVVVVNYCPSLTTVSVAVCEILSVKEWCDLEQG